MFSLVHGKADSLPHMYLVLRARGVASGWRRGLEPPEMGNFCWVAYDVINRHGTSRNGMAKLSQSSLKNFIHTPLFHADIVVFATASAREFDQICQNSPIIVNIDHLEKSEPSRDFWVRQRVPSSN